MDKLFVIGDQLGLTFRKSVAGDEEQIKNLMDIRFGPRFDNGPLNDIEGRYFVAVNGDNKIIAMTGVNDTKYYKGLEVDWTCSHPDYSGHRLITLMLHYLLKDCKQDVYCSCWRLEGHTINLRHAMEYNDFKPAILSRMSADTRYVGVCCEKCVCYDTSKEYCKCYEDLYYRKARM